MSAPRQWVFAYAGNYGPVKKVFACVMQFDAYVAFWRSHVSEVFFESPTLARGSL